MQLDHIDLATPDLAATRDFFTRVMGFRTVAEPAPGWISVLRGDGGPTVVLSRERETGARTYPEGFHVGFQLESEDAVRAFHARLLALGDVEVRGEPSHQHGSFAFYFIAPGGVLTEIGHRS